MVGEFGKFGVRAVWARPGTTPATSHGPYQVSLSCLVGGLDWFARVSFGTIGWAFAVATSRWLLQDSFAESRHIRPRAFISEVGFAPQL